MSLCCGFCMAQLQGSEWVHQRPRMNLTCCTRAWKLKGSFAASSASTLRLRPMLSEASPFMNFEYGTCIMAACGDNAVLANHLSVCHGSGVAHPMLLCTSIDLLYPETAHITLLLLAVPISILKSFLHALTSYANGVLCTSSETLCELEDLVPVHMCLKPLGCQNHQSLKRGMPQRPPVPSCSALKKAVTLPGACWAWDCWSGICQDARRLLGARHR